MAGRHQVLSFPVLSVLLCALSICSGGLAAPRLAVSTAGPTPVDTVRWQVAVAPDPALFSDTGEGFGGTLNIELGLEVAAGSLLNAMSFPTWHEVPGYNPFTNGVSVGVEADAAAGVVFASLGSELLTSDGFVPVLTIETAAASTLSWGGHLHWPGLPFEFIGGRITQAGMNFDSLQGSLAGAASIPGDYNGNGLVEQTDLDLVLLNWGRIAATLPRGWVSDLPNGMIDQTELDGLLLNWGKLRTATASAAVPEPSAGVALAACVLIALCCRRAARHA